MLSFRFVKLKIIVVSLITVFLRIALNAVIYTTDAARTVWYITGTIFPIIFKEIKEKHFRPKIAQIQNFQVVSEL